MWDEKRAQYVSIQKRKLSYWSNRPAGTLPSVIFVCIEVMKLFSEMGVPRRLLYFGLFLILVSYLYTLYTRNKSQDAFTVEQAVLHAIDKIIEHPSVEFRKIIVGYRIDRLHEVTLFAISIGLGSIQMWI